MGKKKQHVTKSFPEEKSDLNIATSVHNFVVSESKLTCPGGTATSCVHDSAVFKVWTVIRGALSIRLKKLPIYSQLLNYTFSE